MRGARHGNKWINARRTGAKTNARESFRAEIEAVVLTPEAAKKSKGGHKPLDSLVLFRMLVRRALYILSNE